MISLLTVLLLSIAMSLVSAARGKFKVPAPAVTGDPGFEGTFRAHHNFALAHAIDDTAVPVENSLMMLTAARAARRPVEAHLFEEGGHAFGVGISGTPTSDWIPLLHLWLGRTLNG